MARQLSATPNIDTPDAQYPAGKIRDEAPPIDGTPVQESLYGDITQFFHKLMRLAGLAYNNVAENETAGFQFVTALTTYVRALASTTTAKGTIETATDAEVQAGTDVSRAVTPAGLESKTATTTRRGITYLASNAEVLAGTDTTKIVTPINLSSVNAALLTKIVIIPAWDMDTDIGINVAHGLTFAKIRSIQAFIRNDDNNVLAPLNIESGSFLYADATLIHLLRANSGWFDNTSFNSSSLARGYIIIKHFV